jgi:hypothetical protein
MHDCEFCSADAARLSKLLFESREAVEMWADTVEHFASQDGYLRQLVQQIDEYRQERGWSSGGFGGET